MVSLEARIGLLDYCFYIYTYKNMHKKCFIPAVKIDALPIFAELTKAVRTVHQ